MLDPRSRTKNIMKSRAWSPSPWSSELSWRKTQTHVVFSVISNITHCGKEKRESLINQEPSEKVLQSELGFEMPVNWMEEWWKDVFLGSGTAGTDGESTRLFEEPHSSSSVGHEWFSVRDGAVDPSIQWCANKQKGCRQMIQSLF